MGGQGGCERGIEVFVNSIFFFWGGGLGGGGVGLGEGSQAGCERRIEVFVKIQKIIWGGGGGGSGGPGVGLGGRIGKVRVDVKEESKFL